MPPIKGASEKNWFTQTFNPITIDPVTGVITVASTLFIKCNEDVQLTYGSLPLFNATIREVLNDTQFRLGNYRNPFSGFVPPNQLSPYSGGQMVIPHQARTLIQPAIIARATYEEEPTMAVRNVLVSWDGAFIGPSNPMPVSFDGTISIGSVEIVGPNPTNYPMIVNQNGSINVNVVSTPVAGTAVINQYSEVLAVPPASTTTVLTYTVPGSATSAVLQRISVAGENIAQWTIFWNAQQIDCRRTFYGNLNEYFEFTTGSSDGFTLAPGDQIVVKVLHNNIAAGNFESRVQVLQIT